MQDAEGDEALIAIVSDGAGSAAHSQKGAELTCEAAGNFFMNLLATPLEKTISVDDVKTCLQEIRSVLRDESSKANTPMREFACTLLGAIITQTTTLAFQIGDGAMVFREYGALRVVFWPESGEYANMTYFVTDDEEDLHLQAGIFERPEEVAVFTDGLQYLALVYATKEAHAPFFDPMFQVLRGTTDLDKCDPLNSHLEDFLDGESVNARTDDDKTLVLATRL